MLLIEGMQRGPMKACPLYYVRSASIGKWDCLTFHHIDVATLYSFAEPFNLKDIDDTSFEAAAIEEVFSSTTRATVNSITFTESAEVNGRREDDGGRNYQSSDASVFGV